MGASVCRFGHNVGVQTENVEEALGCDYFCGGSLGDDAPAFHRDDVVGVAGCE